jgi:hypothetical protein
MRSPSVIGSTLVVTSLFVLIAPLISFVLHFADVPLISKQLQFEAMVTFPRIMASGLVIYLGMCFHCVGREFLTRLDG